MSDGPVPLPLFDEPPLELPFGARLEPMPPVEPLRGEWVGELPGQLDLLGDVA
jgi:hypothetical protein